MHLLGPCRDLLTAVVMLKRISALEVFEFQLVLLFSLAPWRTWHPLGKSLLYYIKKDKT